MQELEKETKMSFEEWYRKIWGHLIEDDFFNNDTKDLVKTAARLAWEASEAETKNKMIQEGYRNDKLVKSKK